MSHRVKPPSASRRRPTQADVAALAGVSTATVSHILSGRSDRRGSGNAQTRARVERAMEQLGYRPNWAGRALRRQRTGLIGALVSGAGNPWRDSLITIAQKEFSRRSLDLVILPETDLEHTMSLLERGVLDACFTVHVDDRDSTSRLGDSPVPMIAFAEDGFEGVPKVRHEYALAAAEAVETLLGRGVRRFIVITEEEPRLDQPDYAFSVPIETVVKEAGAELAQHVVPPRINPSLAPLPWEELEMARAQDPIAVMCVSDRSAIQVAAECSRRSLDLGRSVGVVGRGDLPEGQQTAVPISTLGAEVADYSSVFATLAEASVSGEPITQDWTIPWHFIERETTAKLRRA